MARIYQSALILSTLASCWLGMQIVHEIGHVLAAFAAGETVRKVILHPLEISRTDVSHDRHPLIVIWGGPIVGSLLPIGFLVFAKGLRSGSLFLYQFFAGFCLVANGAYLGVGSFEGVGDAGDLLRFGASRWTLIVFGLLSVPPGFWLWNGLGPHFGLGRSGRAIDRTTAIRAIGITLGISLAEILVGSR